MLTQWRVGRRQRQRALAIQLHHIGLKVRRNQIARLAFGNFFAMVNDQQAVAQTFGLVHEVRGEQNGFALLHQHLQTLPHQVARLRIQAGGRLVQHQHLRLVDECARQTQAPFHAARQLAGFGFGFAGQRTKLQQVGNAGLDVSVFHAEVTAIHQQIFLGGEVGIQGVHLCHHTQAALDGQGIFGHGQILKVGDAACVGFGQAQAHAQGGGFACAVGSNDAQTLAR